MERIEKQIFRPSRRLRKSLGSSSLAAKAATTSAYFGDSLLRGMVGVAIVELATAVWKRLNRPARQHSIGNLIPFPVERVRR